jgi:hypothetical protein
MSTWVEKAWKRVVVTGLSCPQAPSPRTAAQSTLAKAARRRRSDEEGEYCTDASGDGLAITHALRAE